jgi:hypothetical protein
MAGRKPIFKHEEAGVYAALASFGLRDQALLTMGLNTGFRITEQDEAAKASIVFLTSTSPILGSDSSV